MFLVVWEFQVKPEWEERFAQIYSPTGAWAALFLRDANFEKTMLVCDPFRPHVYLTMDFWKSESAYHEFKEKFRIPYESLDRDCEGMTVSEVCLGSFEGHPG